MEPIPDEFIISAEEAEKQLLNIKVSKAVGPDNIPNWILKDLSGIIARPVCAIFNSSIRKGYVPSLWRSADVIPVPKTNPINNLKKDLRPISLTPILAKLLENYPVHPMRKTCPNIDTTQFGAMHGSSTTHALLQILHPIFKAVDDSRNYARLLLIDFSKAFDHIHHGILLDKLKKNGVHPVITKWYSSFLPERK